MKQRNIFNQQTNSNKSKNENRYGKKTRNIIKNTIKDLPNEV
jgi:hypothetical protein